MTRPWITAVGLRIVGLSAIWWAMVEGDTSVLHYGLVLVPLALALGLAVSPPRSAPAPGTAPGVVPGLRRVGAIAAKHKH